MENSFIMDNEQLEINLIKNISSISFYNLIKINKKIYGLLVFYEDGKYINLIELDKNFKYLLKRIMYVYQLEKQNNILVDDETKEILETGNINLNQTFAKRYLDQKGKEKLISTISSQYDYLKSIIVYIIKTLGSVIGETIEIEKINNSWNNSLIIFGKNNGKKVFFPCSLIDESHGMIANILDSGKIAKFEFILKEEKINLRFNSDNITCDLEVKFIDGSYHYNNVIIRDGQVIYNDNGLLLSNIDEKEKDNLAYLLDIDINKFFITKLSWGSFLLTSNKSTNNENYRETIYVDMNSKDVLIKQFITNSYNDGTVKLTTDRIEKQQKIIFVKGTNNNYGVIETKFGEVENASGEYKDKLENRCFYEIFTTDANSLKEVNTKLNLIPIESDCYISGNNDILTEYRLKKIIEGSVK